MNRKGFFKTVAAGIAALVVGKELRTLPQSGDVLLIHGWSIPDVHHNWIHDFNLPACIYHDMSGEKIFHNNTFMGGHKSYVDYQKTLFKDEANEG